MDKVGYANCLYAHIQSGDFPAFQKTLHEIAACPPLLKQVLWHNAFEYDNDRFTLVQSATVHAIETGQMEMLLELIRLGAETSWVIGLPRPVLRRQNACAEYHAHMNESDDEYVEFVEACDDSVAEMDSVDASFERALEEGKPHAVQIMFKLSLCAPEVEALTEQLNDAVGRRTSLFFMSPIVYQYLGGLDFTALIHQSNNIEALAPSETASFQSKKSRGVTAKL